MVSVAQSVVRAEHDARPVIPRNDTNLWTKAESIRDDLYRELVEACRERSVEALVLHSGPYVFPAWVKFEAWQPQGDRATTHRSSALVTIDPKPYHSYEFEFAVTYTVGNRTRTVPRAVPLSAEEIRELLSHLIDGGPKPGFRRFRDAGFQIWRPKNEIQGLGVDIPGLLVIGAFVGGLLTMGIPVLAFLLWIGAIAMFLLNRQRKAIVRVDGKPDGEPRSLVRVDSWQTVLFDLGQEQPMVKERLLDAFRGGLNTQVRFRQEQVWYWGLDGKEEREQIVLTAGRGIVFCQIYSYGQDLYVGWDGHLNRGQWVEQTVATGIDKSSRNPITISRVVPGTQPATEYDLVDLSCLMEWTHAQIVKVLKQLIAERRIDQEIDFSVQRGERQRVAASASAAATGVADKMRKVFQRTA